MTGSTLAAELRGDLSGWLSFEELTSLSDEEFLEQYTRGSDLDGIPLLTGEALGAKIAEVTNRSEFALYLYNEEERRREVPLEEPDVEDLGAFALYLYNMSQRERLEEASAMTDTTNGETT